MLALLVIAVAVCARLHRRPTLRSAPPIPERAARDLPRPVPRLLIGAALTVVAKRLVVTEELEDDYPEQHPDQQREIAADRPRERQPDHPQAPAARRRRGDRRRAGPRGADARLSRSAGVGHEAAWTRRHGGAAAASSTRRAGRSRAADDRGADVLHRRSRRAPTPRTSPRRWWSSAWIPPKLQLPPGRAGLGAGGDPRLLEDLHACRLRDRALPQADLPGARAAGRARLPVPLLDLRSSHRRHRHLRAGRPAAAAAAADDRPRRRAARCRATSRARVGPCWWGSDGSAPA